jgi:hypothetical protein
MPSWLVKQRQPCNTYLPKNHGGEITTSIELKRSTEEEKNQQIGNVRVNQEARSAMCVGEDDVVLPAALTVLQVTVGERRSLFEGLMDAVKYHSLGQISHALYEVGSIGGKCECKISPHWLSLRNWSFNPPFSLLEQTHHSLRRAVYRLQRLTIYRISYG